ncbi:hypothetical protein SVIOM342S_06523 [Streptomyces violaceorubidus]
MPVAGRGRGLPALGRRREAGPTAHQRRTAGDARASTGAGAVAVFDPEGAFLALVEEQKGKAKSLAVFA